MTLALDMSASSSIVLSPAQVEQFHREGYLVVPDLLTEEEVTRFVAYEAEPRPEGWRHGLRHHVEDPEWRYLAEHPRIAGGAAQLLRGRPMIVQTAYTEKAPAGGKGIAFHQDLHYLPCEPKTLMACWVAMSDTDPENGGLCVVPGSHQQGLYATRESREEAEEYETWAGDYLMRDREGMEWIRRMYSFEIEGVRAEDIVHLTVLQGSGVFFDGHTIHGSFANHSKDRPRRAWAVHYVRQGTWVFRADVQALTPVRHG